MGRTRNSSRFAAFLSSFAVQAGYNYDRFQNLGFAAVLLPALKDIYPDQEDLKEALKRHLIYFNTNPYLATFTAGALINAEEERSEFPPGDVDDAWMERFKQASSSVLGNLGDRFFWGGLRPLACLLGILAYLLSPLYGILTLLVVYNIPQLIIRAEGMRVGYESGRGMVTVVAGDLGSRAILWVKRLGALALGMLVPFIVAHPSTPDSIEGITVVVVFGSAGWFLLKGRKLRIPTLLLLILLVSIYSVLA